MCMFQYSRGEGGGGGVNGREGGGVCFGSLIKTIGDLNDFFEVIIMNVCLKNN